MSDALDILTLEIGTAFQRLDIAISSEDEFLDFLAELGWDCPSDSLPKLTTLRDSVRRVVEMSEGVERGTSADPAQATEAIRQAFRDLNCLHFLTGAPPGIETQLSHQLLNFLIFDYIFERAPKFGVSLGFLGFATIEEISEAQGRLAYYRKSIQVRKMADFIPDPANYMSGVYKWGQPEFDADAFLESLAIIFEAWGFRVQYSGRLKDLVSILSKNAVDPYSITNAGLELTIFEELCGSFSNVVRITIYPLPKTPTEQPGIALIPLISAELEAGLDLSELIEMSMSSGVHLNGDVGLVIRPTEGVRFCAGLDGNGVSNLDGDLSISVGYAVKEGSILLLGSSEGSGLSVAAISSTAGTRFHSRRGSNAFIELTLSDARLTVRPEPGDSDGFISKLLPSNGLSFEFDTTIGFSTDEGIYFRGSGGLTVRLPIHLSLGPVSVDGAILAVKVPSPSTSDFGIDIELGADIAAKLGVLSASVQNIGLRATIAFPDDASGNAGPVNLDLAFKPPNGVALAVKAAVVSGGGDLYLDHDLGKYHGNLELDLSGIVTVKAICIIETQMPDGSEGFSLLVVITGEFGSPIQLGFGFTLSGVGGLLGLNRTMRLEELAEGVRTGAVESVMFPQNIVENAPRIVSDMGRFFPSEEGRFLIGPMAKLGWGTPQLVSATLGVIIEVPPGNVAILGVLSCTLPDEDNALLVLKIKFIGALEVDKSRLWFFASLYESRVLFITLDGEAGLLIAWGGQANFVLSVGGFHPRFNAPALPFPTPRRVAISILNESFARIRVEGYFAVTSNTVQFGARVEIYFRASEFSIEGHIGFDALFEFDPFYFIINFSASVSVKAFGAGLFSVRIRGALEGTSPWHVEGEGSISVLFFDIDVPFSHTWGDSADTVLPEIEALKILKAELEKDANWQALPPPGTANSVSLREISPTSELIQHPVGALQLAQRRIPLETRIELVGNQRISDVTMLRITLRNEADERIPENGDLEEFGKVREPFATAQSRALSPAQKLSAPAFEDQVAGVMISTLGGATRTSHAVKRTVLHELFTIDTNYKHHARKYFAVVAKWFFVMLSGNSTARSARAKAQRDRLEPFNDKIEAERPAYVLARTKDNVAVAGIQYATMTEAQDALDAGGGVTGEELHVLPMAEARLAA